MPLYRGLLKAEPVLEDVVRDLYRCYRELGDLAALIREDRHLRQALRETLADPDDPDDDPEQYEPEPETVALFDEVRAELEARAGPRSPGVRREAATRVAGGAGRPDLSGSDARTRSVVLTLAPADEGEHDGHGHHDADAEGHLEGRGHRQRAEADPGGEQRRAQERDDHDGDERAERGGRRGHRVLPQV